MKNKSSVLAAGIIVVIGILLLLVYCHKKSHMPKVYFANLKDGAEIESPFKVEMKAENLVVEAATNGVIRGHGHFHIIIDSPLPPTGEPVPMDSLHLHYGKGQTNAMVSLPDGDHTLTLQFADGNHFPYDPQVTQTVHIRVTKQNPPSVGSSGATETSVETETQTKTVHNSGEATEPGNNAMKPTPVPNTPPPINPGYGGGMGSGR